MFDIFYESEKFVNAVKFTDSFKFCITRINIKILNYYKVSLVKKSTNPIIIRKQKFTLNTTCQW